LTLGATILAALGGQMGWPILLWGALVPRQVLAGQIWRLVTWPLFEFSLPPIGLVFACACLVTFGRELVYRWGPLGFIRVYLLMAVVGGSATCALAFIWPAILDFPYFTSWAVIDGLIIAWAIINPFAQLMFNFVLPLVGRQIIYATIGINVLAGIFFGPAIVIPHFAVIVFTLIYFRDPALRRLWLKLQLGALQRVPRRRTSHLHPVDTDDRDKPRWLH
jgi:membrane associated rhomboid family serine protease